MSKLDQLINEIQSGSGEGKEINAEWSYNDFSPPKDGFFVERERPKKAIEITPVKWKVRYGDRAKKEDFHLTDTNGHLLPLHKVMEQLYGPEIVTTDTDIDTFTMSLRGVEPDTDTDTAENNKIKIDPDVIFEAMRNTHNVELSGVEEWRLQTIVKPTIIDDVLQDVEWEIEEVHNNKDKDEFRGVVPLGSDSYISDKISGLKVEKFRVHMFIAIVTRWKLDWGYRHTIDMVRERHLANAKRLDIIR